MNAQQKRLAYKAINENVEDTTARQIVRYVLECELFNQDTVSPSNDYLANKYNWTLETTKVAISKAKKSQFIATTGYGKKRCLELNVSFLKGKMAEIYQKTIKPKVDFSDVLPNGLPNTLPNGLPNTLPNGLPNTFSGKNTSSKAKTAIFKGDNNNSNNNNDNNKLSNESVSHKTLKEFRNLRRKQKGKKKWTPRRTKKQKETVDAFKWIEDFKQKGYEQHGMMFMEVKDESRNKAVRKLVIRAYQVIGDLGELHDWWFAGEGEWANYEPENCYSTKMLERFKNSKAKKENKNYIYLNGNNS